MGIDAPLNRIEVYDNSHIQGTNAVGAMIVAGPDGLVKNAYRKFTIRGIAESSAGQRTPLPAPAGESHKAGVREARRRRTAPAATIMR